MIKRTIEVSQKPAHLAVRLDQLLIQPHDEHLDGAAAASIPCEDLGMVVVDQGRCTYSHHALMKIAEFGGVLVVCGRDHLPAAVLLPLADHTQVVWRIHDQINVSKPLRKQLWQQIVRAKISAQAMNLADGSPARGRLLAMMREVRSGDPTNVEAQAAKLYWSNWLQFPSPSGRGAGGEGDSAISFRRNADGDDPLNIMLNYGYAILRASIARAIVAAGLTPALGFHHSNRSNAFCLADDLIEPLRPIVDHRARELYLDHSRRELNQTTKAGLLELLGRPVMLGGERGPLMVQIHKMVASLVRCYAGEEKKLDVPTAIERDCEAERC